MKADLIVFALVAAAILVAAVLALVKAVVALARAVRRIREPLVCRYGALPQPRKGLRARHGQSYKETVQEQVRGT